MVVDAITPIQIRRPGSGRVLGRCLSYLRPYWKFAVGAYMAMLLYNGITLVIPQVIRIVIDRGIQAGDVGLVGRGVPALLGLALVRGLMVFLSGRWIEIASQNVAYDVRNSLHDKLQSFSFSYHDRARTGQLLARAVSDVDRVRYVTGRAILRMAEVVTLIAGIAVSMFLMNGKLALLTLTVVPLLAYVALEFGRRYRPLSKGIQHQLGELTTYLEQNLRGARVVKAFAQEEAQAAAYQKENTLLFDLNVQALRMRSWVLPLLNYVTGAATILILLYGGQLVIRGTLTLGALVAFTTYTGQLLSPVRRLGVITAGIVQAIASSERVFEILDTQSEVKDAPGAQPIGSVRGQIRFENVSFDYFGHEKVLNGIDFEVQPGEMVAILGTTGSGKSTIINLLPRFYDPSEGRILIDGHDISKVTLNSLREQIGIVFQDTTLFATTIRENISFGRPHARDVDIAAAARAAAADSFIDQLPQQYDTPVGEQGVTLSGGQKQRIAIARAILKDARILILDDATSSVDAETEAQVQAALSRLMQGRTSFVIAQRLSTIRQADQILVLDRGRIAARGQRTAEYTAHQYLLRTSGLYAEIYHRQLCPQEKVRQPVDVEGGRG